MLPLITTKHLCRKEITINTKVILIHGIRYFKSDDKNIFIGGNKTTFYQIILLNLIQQTTIILVNCRANAHNCYSETVYTISNKHTLNFKNSV